MSNSVESHEPFRLIVKTWVIVTDTPRIMKIILNFSVVVGVTNGSMTHVNPLRECRKNQELMSTRNICMFFPMIKFNIPQLWIGQVWFWMHASQTLHIFSVSEYRFGYHLYYCAKASMCTIRAYLMQYLQDLIWKGWPPDNCRVWHHLHNSCFNSTIATWFPQEFIVTYSWPDSFLFPNTLQL